MALVVVICSLLTLFVAVASSNGQLEGESPHSSEFALRRLPFVSARLKAFYVERELFSGSCKLSRREGPAACLQVLGQDRQIREEHLAWQEFGHGKLFLWQSR